MLLGDSPTTFFINISQMEGLPLQQYPPRPADYLRAAETVGRIDGAGLFSRKRGYCTLFPASGDILPKHSILGALYLIHI